MRELYRIRLQTTFAVNSVMDYAPFRGMFRGVTETSGVSR